MSRKAIAAFFAIMLMLIASDAVYAAPTMKVSATTTQSSVALSWSKVKNASGYEVTAAGRKVSVKKTSTKVAGLKSGLALKVQVKAYKYKKVRQYFNTKTKKWVNKKPSFRFWKGKKQRVRTVKTYLCSRTLKAKTKEKPSSFPVSLKLVNRAKAPVGDVHCYISGEIFQSETQLGANGTTQINLPPGKYSVWIDDSKEVYSLPECQITVKGKENYVLVCQENTSLLDVFVEAEESTEATITIEDGSGEVISSNEISLEEGTSCPVTEEVLRDEYVVRIEKGKEVVEEECIIVDECNKVFSASFKI